jgi:hypothetical protein
MSPPQNPPSILQKSMTRLASYTHCSFFFFPPSWIDQHNFETLKRWLPRCAELLVVFFLSTFIHTFGHKISKGYPYDNTIPKTTQPNVSIHCYTTSVLSPLQNIERLDCNVNLISWSGGYLVIHTTIGAQPQLYGDERQDHCVVLVGVVFPFGTRWVVSSSTQRCFAWCHTNSMKQKCACECWGMHPNGTTPFTYSISLRSASTLTKQIIILVYFIFKI